MILDIIAYFTFFILSDYLLKFINIQGRYYCNHFMANMIMVYQTLPDTIYCYTNFNSIGEYPQNYSAMNIVFALHFYHMAVYYYKLRYEDWLHHIIMIFFTLPLTLFFDYGAIMGHAIFFTTGLPGGIDYFLLFLVRNRLIHRYIEKEINTRLNLWIRCPGCISNVTICLLYFFKQYDTAMMTYFNYFSFLFIIISVYWNGIYFMERVVSDYAKIAYKPDYMQS
jgi:hypothetical protein